MQNEITAFPPPLMTPKAAEKMAAESAVIVEILKEYRAAAQDGAGDLVF